MIEEIMSKEKMIYRRNRLIEYQKTRDMQFGEGYNIIDENISIINQLLYLREKQEQQIDQLTNNWNELEEWLDKVVKITANIDEKMTCKNVLDKMKEIKERKNENI